MAYKNAVKCSQNIFVLYDILLEKNICLFLGRGYEKFWDFLKKKKKLRSGPTAGGGVLSKRYLLWRTLTNNIINIIIGDYNDFLLISFILFPLITTPVVKSTSTDFQFPRDKNKILVYRFPVPGSNCNEKLFKCQLR